MLLNIKIILLNIFLLRIQTVYGAQYDEIKAHGILL